MTLVEQTTPTLAQALRASREQQGLTLSELADQLKLPVEKVEALESVDDLASMNAFDRGHLRNYAALLNLDLAPYELNEAQQKQVAASIKLIQQKELNFHSFKWVKRVFVMAFIALLAVAVYWGAAQVIEQTLTEHVEPANGTSSIPAGMSVQSVPLETVLPDALPSTETMTENP